MAGRLKNLCPYPAWMLPGQLGSEGMVCASKKLSTAGQGLGSHTYQQLQRTSVPGLPHRQLPGEPEARCAKSRCQQGHALPTGSREGPSWPCPGLWQLLALPGTCITPVCLFHHVGLPLCVSISHLPLCGRKNLTTLGLSRTPSQLDHISKDPTSK